MSKNISLFLFPIWLISFIVGPSLPTLQSEPSAQVITFSDVPSTHWAYQFIESLYLAGITGDAPPTHSAIVRTIW